MNPEKVFEIAKRVYDRYPVNRKEKAGCETECSKRDGLRLEAVKRELREQKEKVEAPIPMNELT